MVVDHNSLIPGEAYRAGQPLICPSRFSMFLILSQVLPQSDATAELRSLREQWKLVAPRRLKAYGGSDVIGDLEQIGGVSSQTV